jgi:nucleotide-binding universal stress UspA family protein
MSRALYRHIGVPVDLEHLDRLDKALATAVDLARRHGARLTLVGVTGPAPSPVAHNPAEYRGKLDALAQRLAASHQVAVDARSAVVGDPAADLDRALDRELHELGVDLVVMASHLPGLRDYVFHSNAGFLASHTDLSVFVVRG